MLLVLVPIYCILCNLCSLAFGGLIYAVSYNSNTIFYVILISVTICVVCFLLLYAKTTQAIGIIFVDIASNLAFIFLLVLLLLAYLCTFGLESTIRVTLMAIFTTEFGFLISLQI